MSKIDEYNEALENSKLTESFIERSNNKTTDKFGIRIKIVESWISSYGSSSAHSWPDIIIKEFCSMFNERKFLKQTLSEAAKRLNAKADKKLKAAANEASEILKQLEVQNDQEYAVLGVNPVSLCEGK